ncbi:TIGR02678 family protein [Lentzea sp. BCCO 10_0856]|uniref:TIGR02678 family protein n=1 Tax=Lentzea miocenica TaxID=3095431 RepID=A0ABU4TG29_9PSEU|nr:TIGR02678 family protein [Lentzea sp. BCCO 10_0856]MDX8037106.1 TIGR02678 family protein [Lentzea sp. BCCO 10_0856]
MNHFDNLSDIDAANVVRCARTLLRRPLLRSDGPDGELLSLVYRHRVVLQDMFAGLLGYRLVVERRFARLYKSGPGRDDTRGVLTMSPRGYAYLALTLAVLTGIGRQTLLSRLVADIRSAAAEAGIDAPDDVGERRALTAALRHLVSLGVLQETEGSVAQDVLPQEALITIDTDLLGQLVTGPVGEAENPAHLIELAARPGPRGVEHAVRRKLVETPLVLYADLPDDQSEWLRRNQRKETALLEQAFGLYTECRVEGVLAADPEDFLTDLSFPGVSTVARIALLALPDLVDDEAEDAPARHVVAVERIREVCAQLVEDYPAAWSKQFTDDLDRLVAEVTELLRRMGLAVPHEQGWSISAAVHRWLPSPDGDPEREQPEQPVVVPEVPSWSLFDEENVS